MPTLHQVSTFSSSNPEGTQISDLLVLRGPSQKQESSIRFLRGQLSYGGIYHRSFTAERKDKFSHEYFTSLVKKNFIQP